MIVEGFKIKGTGCVSCDNCHKLFGIDYIDNFNTKQGTGDKEPWKISCPYCGHISEQYSVKDVMFWKAEQD